MQSARTPLRSIAFAFGTGFGAGYSPVAPGTAGSLVGLLFAFGASRLDLPGQAAALALCSGLAIWASGVVADAVGKKDPGVVVADEIAGMMVTMIALPFTAFSACAGFLLFRVMDVLKPPPARGFERFRGGYGIVADDLMAGVYAHLALRGVLALAARAGIA
jgi:phosphatidylglycerophosphatase A